jgi:hypothetical protein
MKIVSSAALAECCVRSKTSLASGLGVGLASNTKWASAH